MNLKKIALIYIILLTVFSFGLRLFRISEPNHYYFDEVYHAVTAKAYADGEKAAYNPFSPPPKEGTAYDWLHPPLAKLFQATTIKIFGDTPLGWRLASVIVGTAIIPATFILGLLLFGPVVAMFASTIIAFENLTFTMSRITMNDVFIGFFALVAFIFASLYIRREKLIYLILTGIFLGCAWASKWTGTYAIAGVFLILLWHQFQQKKLDLKLFLVVIIPPIVYLASYGQYFLLGYKVRDFFALHQQIWWYQNRHDLEHSYATTPLFCVPNGLNGPKTWCPWVLDVRPVYFSYEQYGEKAGYIYNLGNPLIFWAGIAGVSYLIGKYFEDRRKEYLIIMVGYFIFWLPWIFSPRILFFHHYLPSLPFLSIALGFSLTKIYETKLKILSFVILIAIIAAFFYFYPISSGWPIKPEDIEKYMWLKTWR